MAVGTDLIGELDDFQSDKFLIRARALHSAEIIDPRHQWKRRCCDGLANKV